MKIKIRKWIFKSNSLTDVYLKGIKKGWAQAMALARTNPDMTYEEASKILMDAKLVTRNGETKTTVRKATKAVQVEKERQTNRKYYNRNINMLRAKYMGKWVVIAFGELAAVGGDIHVADGVAPDALTRFVMPITESGLPPKEFIS